MKLKGNYTYKGSITVSEKILDELNVLLGVYCSRMEYSAILSNGTCIEFADYKELISFENYKNYKIKKIEIRGYKEEFYSNIHIQLSNNNGITYKNESIICFYEFHDKGDITLFLETLSKIVDKSKEKYTLLNICTPYRISLTVIYLYLFYFYLIGSDNEVMQRRVNIFFALTFSFLVLVLFLFYCIRVFDKKVWLPLFPKAILK